MMRGMLGRVLGMVAMIAAVSVGVAGLAGRPRSDAPSSARDTSDQSNFTTRDPGRSGWSSAPTKAGSPGEVRLSRAGDSHFYADVNIDGTNIRMLVDSGASIVALTRADAEAIGIDVDRLPTAGAAQTAGGMVPVRPVMLDSIDIDGIEVRGVQAAVLDSDMGISLLGQSYLSKLGAVTVEGDMMTLR